MKRATLLILFSVSFSCTVLFVYSEPDHPHTFKNDEQCIVQEDGKYSEERYLQIYKQLCDIAVSDNRSSEEKVDIFREMIESNSFNKKYAAVSVLYRWHSDQIKIFSPLTKIIYKQLIGMSDEYNKSGKAHREQVFFISYCIAILPKLGMRQSQLYDLLAIESLSTFTHELAKAIISCENMNIIDEYDKIIRNLCCQKITKERWIEILGFIETPNDYSDKNIDIAEVIDRWKRDVWNETVKAYGRMSEDVRQDLWERMYRQLESHDSDERHQALISIQVLAKDYPSLMENEKERIIRYLEQIEQHKLKKDDALLVKFIRLFLKRGEIDNQSP